MQVQIDAAVRLALRAAGMPASSPPPPASTPGKRYDDNTVLQQSRENGRAAQEYEAEPGHSLLTEGIAGASTPVVSSDDNTVIHENGRQTDISPFDASKYVLGKLCPRGHDYQGTGQSLRRLPKFTCWECHKAGERERRKAKR
jgi:hypothetical protein